MSVLKNDVTITVNEFKNFEHEIDPDFGYYEGHTRRLLSNGEWEESEQTIPAGTYVVTTSQRHGKLAGVLLEPESNDGLASWNYFDAGISSEKESRVYPVLKSLTDYSVLDKNNLKAVSETPLDWEEPEATLNGGDSGGGCNSGLANILSVIVPMSAGTLMYFVKRKYK